MTHARAPQALLLSYQRIGRRRLAVVASVVILLFASLSADLLSGPARLRPSEVGAALLHPHSGDSAIQTIVWTFRLPTALMALAIGASLGVAGAEMQTVLRNPLASPYTLGVSAAACFGAAIVFVVGTGATALSATLLIPLSAFLCAMACSVAVYGFDRFRGGKMETIVVGGVALHFLFSSGIGFLQYLASDDALQAIVFWMFGTLQGATWNQLAVISGVLAVSVILLGGSAWQLTALRLGDSQAQSLGIDVRQLRLRTLTMISVLTATAVCFTGSIGFIGLVAPHIARMTVGEDQRYFMPLSALYGALLVSMAAVVSKSLLPGTIVPIGITTAAIGAPFFAGLALWTRKSYW